jgi:hypothetical protein
MFPDNLILRPSGYHFGEQSPTLGAPFSAGTTSLYAVEEKIKGGDRVLIAPPPDGRRNWDCQTYAVVDEKHTCTAAMGSNGERPTTEGGKGCRTCWLYRDVSVQYTAHG